MGDQPTRQHDALALPQGSGSTSLQREGSQSSSRSGGVPSPRRHDSSKILPELSIDSSATSSASGSRSGSHISTPRLLSRRNSSKEPHTSRSFLSRKLSIKSKGKAKEEHIEMPETVTPDSIKGEQAVMEVCVQHRWYRCLLYRVETPLVNIERDPGTGRKMINQYLVRCHRVLWAYSAGSARNRTRDTRSCQAWSRHVDRVLWGCGVAWRSESRQCILRESKP